MSVDHGGCVVGESVDDGGPGRIPAWGWMLTFGQVFGLVTSIQTFSCNRATQLALMYTLLDTLADHLSGGSFDDLCTLRVAPKAARRARDGM